VTPDMPDEIVDQYVWVPETDRDWIVLAPDDHRLCRRPQCHRRAVAALMRTQRQQGWPHRTHRVAWHYCDQHLYGRRLVDGLLLRPIPRKALT